VNAERCEKRSVTRKALLNSLGTWFAIFLKSPGQYEQRVSVEHQGRFGDSEDAPGFRLSYDSTRFHLGGVAVADLVVVNGEVVLHHSSARIRTLIRCIKRVREDAETTSQAPAGGASASPRAKEWSCLVSSTV